MHYRGEVLKRIEINERERIDIISRKDGSFQFIYRKPCNDDSSPQFESPPFITVETAEAAARKALGLALKPEAASPGLETSALRTI